MSDTYRTAPAPLAAPLDTWPPHWSWGPPAAPWTGSTPTPAETEQMLADRAARLADRRRPPWETAARPPERPTRRRPWERAA